MQNALEAARLTGERVVYSVEAESAKQPGLRDLIPAGANIYELNHLAERLAGMEGGQAACASVIADKYVIMSNHIGLIGGLARMPLSAAKDGVRGVISPSRRTG